MSDFTGIIVVILAIICMLQAQRQAISGPERRTYALLGSAASIMVAIEAAHRGVPGVMVLFAAGAGFSLVSLLLDFFKARNPDM